MMCDDVAGVITVSYPLEKLVIWIIDQKEELNRFKTNSTKKLNLLKKLISNYTAKEQNEVMRYFKSNGNNKPIKTIDKLQVDLYKVHHHQCVERTKQRQKESEVKIQQIIKLTWWDDKKYTDEVIADVIGVSELTLRHAKEVILKRVAKAVEYV